MLRSRVRCLAIVLLAAVLFFGMALSANAASGVSVFIDGQKLISDVDPVIVQDRTLVPLSAISKGLGMSVQWLEEVRMVRIFSVGTVPPETLPPMTERKSMETPLVYIDDVPLYSDVDPVIIQGRTMVPLGAISEGLGMKVEWDGAARHVYITKPAPPPSEPEVPAEPEVTEPEPGPSPEPIAPEVPQVQYLGIGIMGNSQADAPAMTRVALEAIALKIYPGIDASEAAACVSRAQASVKSRRQELTTQEVTDLTLALNRNRTEINQYSPAQIEEILDSMAATYYKLAELYLEKGRQYGIRGDIAFFQAAHETGWWRFGGLVTPDQNNYCGLSATGKAATAEEQLRGADPARCCFVEGKHGAFFDTPATGVEAQLQHLYAYATVADLPAGVDLVSPRFTLVRRGIAFNWEDLGGKWAVPGYPRGAPNYYETMPDPFAAAFANGQTYGQTILAYYSRTGWEQ